MGTPKLKTIAKMIEKKFPGYKVKVDRWTESTDRKIPGSRLRWPGKGRDGYRLDVYDQSWKLIFRHTGSETYRRNSEVIEWMEKHEKELVGK